MTAAYEKKPHLFASQNVRRPTDSFCRSQHSQWPQQKLIAEIGRASCRERVKITVNAATALHQNDKDVIYPTGVSSHNCCGDVRTREPTRSTKADTQVPCSM